MRKAALAGVALVVIGAGCLLAFRWVGGGARQGPVDRWDLEARDCAVPWGVASAGGSGFALVFPGGDVPDRRAWALVKCARGAPAQIVAHGTGAPMVLVVSPDAQQATVVTREMTSHPTTSYVTWLDLAGKSARVRAVFPGEHVRPQSWAPDSSGWVALRLYTHQPILHRCDGSTLPLALPPDPQADGGAPSWSGAIRFVRPRTGSASADVLMRNGRLYECFPDRAEFRAQLPVSNVAETCIGVDGDTLFVLSKETLVRVHPKESRFEAKPLRGLAAQLAVDWPMCQVQALTDDVVVVGIQEGPLSQFSRGTGWPLYPWRLYAVRFSDMRLTEVTTLPPSSLQLPLLAAGNGGAWVLARDPQRQAYTMRFFPISER